jgi:hypothetical protein
MANVCDLGVNSADRPANSLDALRGRISRLVVCQQGLQLSLEAGLQTLLADHPVLDESISSAITALSEVKADTETLQGIAPSTDATTEILGASLEAVAMSVNVFEAALNTVGDDAQLANVDLQNVLQQQQQTLQMASNISKMLHDAAVAVIRKISA